MLRVAARSVRASPVSALGAARSMSTGSHTAELVQRKDTTAPVAVISPVSVDEHTATVFFMHGLGVSFVRVSSLSSPFTLPAQDSCHGWAQAVIQFMCPVMPHARFVLPTAPTVPVTLNQGYPCPAWYDITSLEVDRSQQECQGLDASRHYIQQLMNDEVVAGVPYSRHVVAGFSQGGALSLFTGLTTTPPVAGIGCLSGYLPRAEEVKATFPQSVKHTPVWFAHGDSDEVVKPDWGKGSCEAVKEMGVESVQHKTYRHMAHEALPEELEEFSAWLAGVLPAGVDTAAVRAAAAEQADALGLAQRAALDK